MPKPPTTPKTALGVAMQARRAGATVPAAAAEIGLSAPGYYRLEAGSRRPDTDSTVKLARWLGWTAEQVIEGARVPAEG